MHAPPAPLNPVITVDSFAKWGIDLMTWKPPSESSHHYIIVVVDYFTKWAETMQTYSNNVDTAT